MRAQYVVPLVEVVVPQLEAEQLELLLKRNA